MICEKLHLSERRGWTQREWFCELLNIFVATLKQENLCSLEGPRFASVNLGISRETISCESFRHKTLLFMGLREAKPGGFQTRVFPTFFGKGPDCVADPFGTVPRRCS